MPSKAVNDATDKPSESSARNPDDTSRKLEEYRLLFDTAADPVVIMDLQGNILECNLTLLNIYGYQRDELIGKHIRILHHESDDIEQVLHNIEQEDDKVTPHEYLHCTKQKETFPVEVCSSEITFNGQSAQLSTIRDITLRKKTRNALHESEKRFRLAFESSAVGKALSLVNGPFFWVNQRLCDMLGYTSEELIGTKATELTHPDDLEISKASIKHIMSSTSDSDSFSLEKRYISKSGQVVWANTMVSMLKDENQEPLYMIVEMVDITTRKTAEQTNRQLRNYLANVINSMPSVMVGVTPEGAITQWNDKAEKVTGKTYESVVDKNISTIFPHFREELNSVGRAIKSRKTRKKAKIPRQTGNETVYEDITIYPLISNGVEGAVVRIDDVTEQVRLEEMMIQSEKMMSVGGLAAGMAHEINNPLAGMMQNTQVALSRLTSDLQANISCAQDIGISFDQIKEFMIRRNIIHQLETVHSAGARAAKIVQNMLSFARKSPSEKQVCEVVPLLENTLELARSDYDIKHSYDFKKIEIIKQFDPGLPALLCDESKIQQVILNLLKNAAQALYSLKDNPDKPPAIRIEARFVNDMVHIYIKDNGPGIGYAARKKIFEPFFTTKKPGQGTGLGLSVSYFIVVEDHGGQMNVESTPGKGASFRVSLHPYRP